jgi:histidine triad (HIT) family protein
MSTRIVILIFIGIVLAARAGEQPACVFCEIVAGRADASRVVYRDDTVVAFLDRSPRNPGHVLVVPMQHADGILDVPPATAARMIEVAQRIAQAIKRADLKAEGITLQSNTGAAAGQAVFHLHLHVIPRFEGEPPNLGEKRVTPAAELDAVAEKLRKALASSSAPAR